MRENDGDPGTEHDRRMLLPGINDLLVPLG
jgi:hypothetical protein